MLIATCEVERAQERARFGFDGDRSVLKSPVLVDSSVEKR